MKIDTFVGFMKSTAGPAPADRLAAFEEALGASLPEDYRDFLVRANGGAGGGGRFVYKGRGADGKKREGPSIHHVLGFRKESHFSLEWTRACDEGRVPKVLLAIMDDPGGNAICLGIDGPYRGRIYFWDHEDEPDEDEWDGAVETAGNITLVADSFTGFIAGLYDTDKDREKKAGRPADGAGRCLHSFHRSTMRSGCGQVPGGAAMDTGVVRSRHRR